MLSSTTGTESPFPPSSRAYAQSIRIVLRVGTFRNRLALLSKALSGGITVVNKPAQYCDLFLCPAEIVALASWLSLNQLPIDISRTLDLLFFALSQTILQRHSLFPLKAILFATRGVLWHLALPRCSRLYSFIHGFEAGTTRPSYPAFCSGLSIPQFYNPCQLRVISHSP